MPIRPIDMITVAPRSQEASNQQIHEQHRAETAQSNVAQQFGKHVREGSEVVIQTSKGEQTEYRYDAKEKGNGSYHANKHKREKKGKEEKEQNKTEEIKLSNFDIRI